jgi:acetyl-CoA carboxylase biotin carboxyl carrier protein
MDDKFFLSMVDKFNSSDISELDFNDGNVRLTLRKEGFIAGAQAAAGGVPQTNQSVHLGISAQASGSTSGGGEKIKSPIVGTFYASPGPDTPAFVKPGTKVKAGQTLCILEAMKMMNHLEAEFDCEIISIHANSGELVEYEQELFTVKRS